jgi:protein-disulfide isomerase
VKKTPVLFDALFLFSLMISPLAKSATPPTPPSLAPTVSGTNPGMFTEAQVKQLHKIIHDYLVKNPQVLIEASQAYQDQELAKAKTKTQQSIAKNAIALFNSSVSPTVGNLNGDVTLIEFLDYQCTHCREMSTLVDDLLKSDNKLRVVIKQLPIFGGSSKYAAQAAIVAIKQGPNKFLAFHRNLLEVAPPLTDQKVIEAAKKSGLNVQQLEADMKNKVVDEEINNNMKLAQNLGLLGTPAFILGNRKGTHFEYVPGAVTVNSLKQTINQVRNK